MVNASTDDHHEESGPLLSKQVEEDGSKRSCNDKGNQPKKGKVDAAPDLRDLSVEVGNGLTAERLSLGHGNVVGEPRTREQWDSGLFGCLYEFCSSESEVCFLGSRAPCVLYGSNAEGLISGPQTFRNHCWLYCGLCLIGNTCFFLCLHPCKLPWLWLRLAPRLSFLPCLCLAPCFSFPNRSALRRKFNLEGGCEALNRSCGCCGSCLEDEVQREQCESACDLTTHVFCHQCALCQEGHEIRRRILHPGFNSQPLMEMIPPEEQTMSH
ncbi:hypothetical protein SLEP1_g23422 [Rubroshorea leprosula]|nr:hypothetical protein SLEP1_g23422 [Rubroshorea leprosula]